jgi:hypothetical protein
MCEMPGISAVFTSFVRMTLVSKIMAENEGIFPSQLDSSEKHIELGQIRVFDFRLNIEVKFD